MHDYTCLNKNLHVVNVLGDDMKDYYRDFPYKAWGYLRSDEAANRILSIAFIAHYNIKSDEDFRLRADRGLGGDYAAEKMWVEKNAEARLQHHELTNEVEELYLHDYWKSYLRQGYRSAVFPISRWTLLSQNCETSQSSTVHSRTIEQDSASIVSGKLTGKSQNHTKLESSPWWSIRFGTMRRIHEVRLFNRLDGVFERMALFCLYSSIDGEDWHCRYMKKDPSIFGGADGSPFVWVSEEGFDAVWMRLVVPGDQKYLQLDQVQIYGD